MKIKSKGAYSYNRVWHQNQSALVVQKAVEAHLVKGTSVEDFIYGHTVPYDFCLRTNLKRGSDLMHGGEIQQRISRYFVSRIGGDSLTKVMPPTPAQKRKNPNAPDRRIGIEKGWNVIICNNIADFDWYSLNYDYYIQKAYELIKPVKRRIVS